MSDCVDTVRDIIEYNKTLHSIKEDSDKKRRSSVYSDECLKKDFNKIVLYNLRYNHSKEVRSDIDILEEYNYLIESMNKMNELKEKIICDLNDLNNPSTIERLSRTVITWTWSDDPRKQRLVLRKKLDGELKNLENLIKDVEQQLPLYKSIISVTTTTNINIKKSKLKDKYLKKIRNSKH